MVTDAERRTAAQNLKHFAYDQLQGGLLNTLKVATGVDGTWRDVLLRLVDLIEPTCDRDALLELSDILGSTRETDCRGCRLEGAGCAECSSGVAHEAARRIREALGVGDD